MRIKVLTQCVRLKKAAKGFAVNGKYGLGAIRNSEPKISIQDLDSAPARYYNHSNHSSKF